jgi:two-component system, response regulator PdtaR
MPTFMATFLNSKTILLVDDNRLVLATILQSLSVKGYKIIAAESAEDAEVILASGERIDLAIIDINMPGKNGLELAERFRSLDHVPFMFLSAYSDPGYVEQASRLGTLSYLIKPIDPLKIASVVEAALARAEEPD